MQEGKRRSRCRTCLAAYQRNYWHEHVGDGERLRPTAPASALRDLAAAWPDPWLDVEDRGWYNYETYEWHPTPYDYDSYELPDDDGQTSPLYFL